jgi:hypothetical protein
MSRLSTRVFVDGLNLMHGACRQFSCHWIDLAGVAATVLPPRLFRIECVHLYTSLLDGKVDPGLPEAQHAHLRAIEVARFDLDRRIGILNPHPGCQSRELARVSSFQRTIRRNDLIRNRLPDELRDANGVIRRPERAGW